MEVLIVIIGVVGGSIGTFITGYIAHKRKIKAEREEREKEREREREEREKEREEREKERKRLEEKEREEREKERKRLEEKKEKKFTKFFIDNLSRLLGEFEFNNTIDFVYHFLVYLGCYCRLEYQQFVDESIKLNMFNSAIQYKINKKMVEIENLIRGDINIRQLGELIIKRKDRIFQDFYSNKEIYGLKNQNVGDSNTLGEENRKRVYDKGDKEISKIFENGSDKKNLLKQKFQELLDILKSI